MKLIRCDIENFGCLSNFHMDFTDGLNTICEDNGFGKSTLAAFIRIMFYGFENQGKRDDLVNERAKFKPWQGGVYGGKITFETAGNTYIMAKNFGTKDSEDNFHIRDANTNMEVTCFDVNPGEDLFKLDSQSFLRTAFISQNDCDYSLTDGINAKLSNLAENMDDVNNYEKVDKKLKDIINSMTPKRSTGSLYKIKTRIAELTEQIRRLPVIEKSIEEHEVLLKEAQAKEIELDEEISKCQEKAIKLNGELSASKERSLLYSFSEDEEKEYKRLKALYEKNAPKEEEIQEWKSYLEAEKKLSDEKNTLALMEENFELIKAQNSSDKLSNVWAAISAVSGIAAIVLFFIRMEVGIVAAVTALLFFAVSFISKKRSAMPIEEPKELSELKNSIAELSLKLSEMDQREYEGSSFSGILGFIDVYTDTGFSKDKNNALTEISDAYKRYMNLDAKKKEFLEKVSENNEAAFSLELEKINEEIARLKNENKLISSTINRYNSTIKELKDSYDELESLENELKSIIEQFETESEKYRLLNVTKDLLSEAKISFGNKYVNPIKEGFDKYYGLLIADAKEHIINATGDISFEENGMLRDRKYMSTGLKDLIGICMRMALVDAMYKDEKPFVVLDDPFVNLDDDKIEGGLKLLKDVSKEYQVIYFTCHNSRR